MGYSGLIYAAIVACWAAFLVPRWVRRNEEIERAREEDAARGVRVLERDESPARPPAESGFHFWPPIGGHTSAPFFHERAARTPFTDNPRAGRSSVDGPPGGDPSLDERTGDGVSRDESSAEEQLSARTALDPRPTGHWSVDVGRLEFGAAARRRRRVLAVLVLALTVGTAGVLTGQLPPAAAVVPAVLLAVFLVLARRAAVVEERRRARLRQLARRRAETAAQQDADPSGKRVAVLTEPEPAEPVDPNAWDPVPVPLPTYLTKPKAETPVVRKIDLSSPGAWTSGRLNPASSITLPPQRPVQQPAEEADLPEHRPAVGD